MADAIYNINSIDVILEDYDNLGLNDSWYDIIDILSVPYEEVFDPPFDNNHNIDEYIQRKTIGDDINQMKATTDYKNFDRFSVNIKYDDLQMKMNNGAE